jgi:hypothetical protein
MLAAVVDKNSLRFIIFTGLSFDFGYTCSRTFRHHAISLGNQLTVAAKRRTTSLHPMRLTAATIYSRLYENLSASLATGRIR